MPLTHEDVAFLTQQFDASDHEERDGRTYIRERAITDRLDAVDPSWTWELLGKPEHRDGVVIQTGRLTVKGVWRDGVGMERITATKTGSEANEAEKSAATDALKRAARLFGIGRYLLDLGKGQKPQQQRRDVRQQPSVQVTTTVDPNTGEVDEYAQFVCEKLVVKLAQRGKSQGKPYLIFPNVKQPNQYATDFSRERLRQAGYNVDGWDKVGEYPLDPPALITARMNGDYLNVSEIAQDVPL